MQGRLTRFRRHRAFEQHGVRVAGKNLPEFGGRPRQGFEGEDPGLGESLPAEQAELADIGADVDHCREILSPQGVTVLDGRGNPMAKAGPPAAPAQKPQRFQEFPEQVLHAMDATVWTREDYGTGTAIAVAAPEGQ